jgi:hypothetical protein
LDTLAEEKLKKMKIDASVTIESASVTVDPLKPSKVQEHGEEQQKVPSPPQRAATDEKLSPDSQKTSPYANTVLSTEGRAVCPE